jgi:hypothetical protein
MKRVKEGEYGLCPFYTCINMKHRNLSVLLRRGVEEEGD